jgi:hypothetical protein
MSVKCGFGKVITSASGNRSQAETTPTRKLVY